MFYDLLLLDCRNGKTNWATKIKNILDSLGFGYIWEQQYVNNVSNFISEFLFRLKSSYEQDWHAALISSSKATSYIQFKISFGLEKYINELTVSKFRAAFAQLRCSSHQLRIETGRFYKEPKAERLCLICKLHYIEDEYHFTLVCSTYNDLRYKYIPETFHINPSQHKFNVLMSSSSVPIMKDLATYFLQSYVS